MFWGGPPATPTRKHTGFESSTSRSVVPADPSSFEKLGDPGAGFAVWASLGDVLRGAWLPTLTQLHLKRMRGTRQAASATIEWPIFEEPSRRSWKTIGTSTTSKPSWIAR